MPISPVSGEVLGWQLDSAVVPGATLKQGDLVAFANSEDVLHRAGIVVTADCDFRRRKHARLATLVPILTVELSLEHCLLVDDCERRSDQIEAYVFKQFDVDPIRDPDVRLASLQKKLESGDGPNNETSILAARYILGIVQRVGISQHLNLMKALKTKPKGNDSLVESIRKRGDLMILPSAKALGMAGSIAWVRQIWPVPQSDIALRTSEVAIRPGERVARLDSPYRYRLTQLLAQVFSDIPPDHRTIRTTSQSTYVALGLRPRFAAKVTKLTNLTTPRFEAPTVSFATRKRARLTG